MGRTRKGAVVESAEELEDLLGHFSASPNEARVRFLLALKDDPRVKSEALVGVLGLSDRTIRRWWSEYRTCGLNAFLDYSSVVPLVADGPTDYEDPTALSLLRFLNSLPVGCDMEEWRSDVESALVKYLNGVDRVDVLIPALEALAPSVECDYGQTPHETGRVLELAVGSDGSLGRLRLYAEAELRFDDALSMLEELRPFLTFLFTDAIARINAITARPDVDPTDFLASAIVDSLSPRERDVLVHRLYGYSYSQTAGRLGVSEETVRKCVKSIYRKTNTSSIGELFVRYFSSVDGRSEP